MLTKLKNLFKRKKEKPTISQLKGIKLAFYCGGKAFYYFSDELHYPVERALSATDIYAELEQKMSKEYLANLLESVDASLNKGKITHAIRLLDIAKSRMQHITNIGLMYKLASVLYIADDEDPYRYSLADAEKKIEFWKAHAKDVEGFFLKMPIGELLPSFASSDTNLRSYTAAQVTQLELMFNQHLSVLSDLEDTSDLKNTLVSLMQKELDLMKY